MATKMERGLTEKQLAFALHLAQGLGLAASALAAGYSKAIAGKTASNLSRDPRVIRVVADERIRLQLPPMDIPESHKVMPDPGVDGKPVGKLAAPVEAERQDLPPWVKVVNAEKAEIDAERVMRSLNAVAHSDPRRLFNERGEPIPIQDLDDDTAAAIAGLEVLEQYDGTGKDRVFVGYVKKYKLWPKVAALTTLANIGGLVRRDPAKEPGAGGGPTVVPVVQVFLEPHPQEGGIIIENGG